MGKFRKIKKVAKSYLVLFVLCVWTISGFQQILKNFNSAKEAKAAPGIRAKTVQIWAGMYPGDGLGGQNSNTNLSFSPQSFKLAESGVTIKNAFLIFEAQLNGSADRGNTTGHILAFDACLAPCTPDPWTGVDRVEDNQNATVLQYQDVTGGHYVRLLFNVTAENQLASYNGGGNIMNFAVGYRFNNAATALTIDSAKAKLFLTYTYDDTSANITNTVIYPLESTEAGAQGSKPTAVSSGCTRDSTCPTFTYNMNISEFSERVSQWFEVGGMNTGNAATDVARNINIQGTDIDSSTFFLEAAQGSAQSSWSEAWWSGVQGFTENATQTLEHFHSGGTQHIIGGEVFETYIASSTATTKTKTVSFPIGVIANDITTTGIDYTGQTTVYFAESGISIKKAWIRILMSGNEATTAFNVSLSTKVGNNATSTARTYSLNTGATNIVELGKIYHLIPNSDYAELEAANASLGKNVIVAFQSANAEIEGVSAELMITYTYSADTGGYLTSLSLFAGQSTTTGNSQSVTINNALTSVFPESTGRKTILAAALRANYSLSDSDGAVPTANGLYDANLSTTTPSCSNSYASDADNANAYHEFYKLVTSALNTADNQSYSVCYTNNGHGDTSAGAKMGGWLIYTYQWDAPSNFEQSAYRFFENIDSTEVGNPLAAQDTPITLSSSGQIFRLRILLHNNGGQLPINGQFFKLQFSEKIGGVCSSYSDITTTTVIAFYNNTSVNDGDPLIPTSTDPIHGSPPHTIVNQTYEELNSFTNSQSAINFNQDGKWDFALYDNGAPGGRTYCLRVVQENGNLLTYSVTPEITTVSAPYLTQRGFICENDDGIDVNSNTTSTSENSTLTMEKGERAVFRVQVDNTGNLATTTNFYLEWATTTASCSLSMSWQQLTATSEISWSQGISGANQDQLSSSKISGGQGTFTNGVWVEGTNNTGNFNLSSSTFSEFGFMIHTANAIASTTYCLRLNQAGNPLNNYANFGSLFIVSNPVKKFSKDSVTSLPSSTTDLTYYLDNIGYQRVLTADDLRDSITSNNSIPVFLFARKNTNNTDAITITWEGQSSTSTVSKPVYLQIWNGTSWITLKSNNGSSQNTDFTLSGWKIGSNYYDAENWVYVRVYQESGSQTLRTDLIEISFQPPITISGTIYTDEGNTTSTAGSIISLAVDGEFVASTTASQTNGSYSFSTLAPSTGTPITVFIDQAVGESGAVVTRYQGSGNISDLNIFVNYVILRHEDAGPISNQDIGHFDTDNPGGANVPFTVSAGPPFVLQLKTGHTLYVYSNKTYAPGWNVFTTFLKINSLGTLDAGNTTITVEGSGNAFVANGNFIAATSTMVFKGTATTTIPSITYYNLEINPPSGTPTFIFAAGTLTINNNFIATTSASSQATVDASTNNPSISVGGNFSIAQNQTFLAPGSLSVAGNWTNNGTFSHNNGTVTFNGTTQQTISGNLNGTSSFNILVFTNNSGSNNPFVPSIILNSSTTAATSSITTGSVKVQFLAGATFEFNNIQWNGQASTSRIFLRSSASSTQWYLKVNNPALVSYLDVQDSNASPGQGIDAEDGTNVNSGNNVNWFFVAPTVTTLDATNIRMKSATLNAQINLGDRPQVTLLFYWRQIGSPNWSTTTSQTATTSGNYNQAISGLTASTTYEFYAEIQWAAKTSQGGIKQFTTMPLTLSGNVTIAGNPAAGAKVWVVRDSDMSFIGWTTTTASGTYSIIVPTDNTVYLVAVDYFDSQNNKYYSSAKGIMFVGD